MSPAILGGEVVAAGRITRHALRTRYTAIYPNVYLPNDAELTAAARAEAAWLWSRRRGVIAGRSAAALHGSKWVDPGAPAELLYDNRHSPRALQTYADQIAGRRKDAHSRDVGDDAGPHGLGPGLPQPT